LAVMTVVTTVVEVEATTGIIRSCEKMILSPAS
jgi:hypothetical protein